MKILQITRTDHVDYDEYDSFIVIAKNHKDALKTIEAGAIIGSYGQFTLENTTCQEVKPGEKSKIVLGSYNAG